MLLLEPIYLSEGDTVTFGYFGESLPAGSKVRQPDSEFQYIVRNLLVLNSVYRSLSANVYTVFSVVSQ